MLKFFEPRKKLPDALIHDDAWFTIDVETTGLDPSKDQLLSIGWVAVEDYDIAPEESGHLIIRPERKEVSAGELTAVHRLADDMTVTGVEAETAIGKLLEALRGRKLLAHHVRMEVRFLGPLCRKYSDTHFDVPVADTITREYDITLQANREPVRDELRL